MNLLRLAIFLFGIVLIVSAIYSIIRATLILRGISFPNAKDNNTNSQTDDIIDDYNETN